MIQGSSIPKSLGSARKPKLPDVLGLELASLIEERIIRLEFEPGKHLTEAQICEEFDVSRSPVREAFRQLEAMGLVVRHTRRGIRVTPMTLQDVNEIYLVRTPLEVIAATLAAENATDEDLTFLTHQVGRLEAALKSEDPEDFFSANMAYFDRIHAITGNHTLKSILRTIEKQAMRYRYFAHVHSKEMQKNSTARLRKILRFMKGRDFEAVRKETETMMVEAQAMIVDILKQYPALSENID